MAEIDCREVDADEDDMSSISNGLSTIGLTRLPPPEYTFLKAEISWPCLLPYKAAYLSSTTK
jgi:hypothetical protein